MPGSTRVKLEAAYETERNENIRKNREVLRKLGLETAVPVRPTVEKSHKVTRPKRKVAPKAVEEPIRRSRRVRAMKLDPEERKIESEKLMAEAKEKLEELQTMGLEELGWMTQVVRKPKPGVSATSISATSSRGKRCRWQYLLDNWLGKEVPYGPGTPGGNSPKKAVMQEASEDQGERVTFNKYLSLQPWQNAFCVFINFDRIGGGKYSNVLFHRRSDDHRNAPEHLIWWGSSTQNLATPVIKRYIHSGRLAYAKHVQELGLEYSTDENEDPDQKLYSLQDFNEELEYDENYVAETILLFIRQVDSAYVCMGRMGLEHVSIKYGSVRTEWKLFDIQSDLVKDSARAQELIAYGTDNEYATR
eukprot:Clim_evm12s200 gene=Clim_evmTU12s200